MGHVNFYQDIFHVVNRQIKGICEDLEIKPFATLSAYSSLDRCINYFDIFRKWEEIYDLLPNIQSTLQTDEGGTALKSFLSCFRKDIFRPSVRYMEQLARTPKIDMDEFRYHIAVLYHHFPRHPHLFIDGIIMRMMPKIALNQQVLNYATIELLYGEDSLGFTDFPWVKMRLYDTDGKAIDYRPEMSDGLVYADQEGDRMLFQKPDAPIAPSYGISSHFQTCRFLFDYLTPLFLGYKDESGREFNGRGFYRKPDKASPLTGKIMFVPLYDSGLPARPAGRIMGNFALVFVDEPERTRFVEEHLAGFRTRLFGLARELSHARMDYLTGMNIWHPEDVLQDFLHKTAFVQDWERVMVFDKKSGHVQYCLKRQTTGNGNPECPEFLDDPETYKTELQKCTDDCSVCLSPIFRKQLNSLDGRKEAQSILVDENDRRFYFVALKSILSSKVLSALETFHINSYENLFLGFEFPDYTCIPAAQTDDKEEPTRRMGEAYFNELIPLLDKWLLKQKVLAHSTKSAVAAIISRNHSHHIGSHVIPRTDLEKVIARLDQLGYPNTLPQINGQESELKGSLPAKLEECQKQKRLLRNQFLMHQKTIDIAGKLKMRLDHYIQKKADFLSEIVTEPITTTRTLGFYNDVILTFIQNTLLMDNIGANEGVNFRKGFWNNNRLQIRVGYEDREFKMMLSGGRSCTCNQSASATSYPYSGHCQCPVPHPMQIENPELNDVAVALPGPLGEFALYALLENLIRNAVKHNQEAFRKDPDLCLVLDIRVRELDEADPERNDFYRVEIREQVSRPNRKLLTEIDERIREPVVDRYGQLRKGAWGIAEMKIMANLLSGSDDFATMASSLQVGSDSGLVYGFRMMKPKEVALISKRMDLGSNHMKHGIHNFYSVENFVAYQKQAASPAGFNFVILDRDIGERGKAFGQLLPNRVFIHHDFEMPVPGAVTIDDQFVKFFCEMSPEAMISFLWLQWIEHLSGPGADSIRLALFLGQEEDASPTAEWIAFAQKWEQRQNRPKLSIIYMGDDDNEVIPAVSVGESLAVFDRHFGGYGALPQSAHLFFHEAFDKNSSDFAPVFSSRPSDTILSQLAESALMKVLVLDERIAEVAYDDILQDEASKVFYSTKSRIEVCRWANIYPATHIRIDGGNEEPLHYRVHDQFPRIFVEVSTDRSNGKYIGDLKAYWISEERTGNLKKQRLYPQMVILHQGVLETFFGNRIANEHEHFADTLQGIIHNLREIIPFIAVDSGRGIPANLPPDVKFIPFSLIQEYLMQDRIAKYSLIKTIMNLIRRGNE